MAEVGIRQGCPLLPLLFAVVADLLLRYLQKHFRDHSFLRDVANDMAMLVKDARILPRVLQVLRDARAFSIAHGSSYVQCCCRHTLTRAALRQTLLMSCRRAGLPLHDECMFEQLPNYGSLAHNFQELT